MSSQKSEFARKKISREIFSFASEIRFKNDWLKASWILVVPTDTGSYTTHWSFPYTLSRVHPANPVSFVSCFSFPLIFRQYSFSILARMTCHCRQFRHFVVVRCLWRKRYRLTSVERWAAEQLLVEEGDVQLLELRCGQRESYSRVRWVCTVEI